MATNPLNTASELIIVSESAFQRIQDMIDKPQPPTQALREAMMEISRKRNKVGSTVVVFQHDAGDGISGFTVKCETHDFSVHCPVNKTARLYINEMRTICPGCKKVLEHRIKLAKNER